MTQRSLPVVRTLNTPGVLWCAAINDEGDVLYGDNADFVTLWSAVDEVERWRSKIGWAKDCALPASGQAVVGLYRPGRVAVLGLTDGVVERTVGTDTEKVEVMAVARDGRLAVTGGSGLISERAPRLVDLRGGAPPKKLLKAHKKNWIGSLSLSADGEELATVAGGELLIRPVRARRATHSLHAAPHAAHVAGGLLAWGVNANGMSSPSRLSLLRDGAEVWSIAEGWTDGSPYLVGLAALGDGHALLSFSRGVVLVDVAAGVIVGRYALPAEGQVWKVSGALGGRYAVLWRTQDRKGEIVVVDGEKLRLG